MRLNDIWSSLLDLLLPQACAACDAECDAGAVFCLRCRSDLVGAPTGFEIDGVPVRAVGRYEGALASALKRLKYEARPDLAARLARHVERQLADLGVERRDVLVPVPLSRVRLVERGYNQSALIARALAWRLGCRTAPRLLLRAEGRRQQARLKRLERLDNLKGAIVARGSLPPGTRAILVDDVITTGATVRECVQALKESGTTPRAAVAVALTSRS